MAKHLLLFELSSWTFFAVPAIACCVLFIWRLWRFSFAPIRNPKDPEQLPYWIPFLGHAYTFDKDPHAVLALGQARFARAGRPYSLTIAGKTFYVLTDPQDFNTVYRHATTFTFDPIVEFIYRAFQLPEAAMRNLYQQPLSCGLKNGSSDSSNKNAVNISHKMLLVGMRGKLHHNTYIETAEQLRSMMDLEKICSRFSTTRKGSSTVISLLQLCSNTVLTVSQASHFGSALANIDSTLPEVFWEFDKLCWQIFQRPRILWNKQLTICMDKLLIALEAYANIPIEQRSGMPKFLQNWETECRNLGLSDSDLALLMLIQYFGLNTNTFKACFWLISYLVFNPDLIPQIRHETRAAFSSPFNKNSDTHSTIDWPTIERSSLLNGIWLETLRLCTSPVTIRHLATDFSIKNLTLRKGNLVFLNPRPLHINSAYFGPNPLAFDAKRFVENPEYERHAAFRPFGGGDALCSGRQKAKQTALTFVVCLLHEFDVEMAWSGQIFPEKSRKSCPGISVSPPVEGERGDLWVRLREREREREEDRKGMSEMKGG